ncbi:hypothetical protein [Burkholderia sp. MSMB1835]|uniref:hypothetical protein n=1 Tax=Burkholderia sp. MSMB1835 TaxID=1637876 RepID=UPI00075888A0|nr:hypothetical protein [Burkholderia sp. MSMB1835]KVL38462.1 hypothetical protein WS96_06490 [Burkholderia sp. MSMB1835]
MKLFDRQKWHNDVSIVGNRYLRVPLPKMEAGSFGWIKRWAIDWLVPTGISASATYHLTDAFVGRYRAILPPGAVDDVPLEVMSDLWSRPASQYFFIGFFGLAVLTVAMLLYQQLARPTLRNMLRRRKRPLVSPKPFVLVLALGKLLSTIIPACAVAIAAYAPASGIWGGIGLLIGLIGLVTAGYYHMVYGEMRPPSVISMSFHRPRQSPSIDAGEAVSMTSLTQWRDAHTALQDDANAISDAAGGAFAQNVTASFDLDDVVISVALSIDIDDLPRDRRCAVDAQINRVLNKWRSEGYRSGSLYDGRTLPVPTALSSPSGFTAPLRPSGTTPADSVRVAARSGSTVLIIDDIIIQDQTTTRRSRIMQRREKVFEFVVEAGNDAA